MFGLLDGLARRLIRHGLRRGVLEGDLRWVVIAAGALVVRLLAKPEKEHVIREKVKLGEQLIVTHRLPDGN
jgi:hypothetical protein